jgi:hypothetical protein
VGAIMFKITDQQWMAAFMVIVVFALWRIERVLALIAVRLEALRERRDEQS